MGEARDVNKEQQISLRLEPEVAERAEALVETMSDLAEYKAFRLTRASVLRMAMLEGLAALEARHGAGAAPPKAPKSRARR